MTKKHFDHILIAAVLDRPPQARQVREDYQPTEQPISEEELRRHPLIPLFPSLVMRKDSEVDTARRDKIANHVEQLARGLTPFSVQWGPEIEMSESAKSPLHAREITHGRDKILAIRNALGCLATKQEILYNARGNLGADSLLYAQYKPDGTLMPSGIREKQIDFISIFTTRSYDKSSSLGGGPRSTTRCDYPLGSYCASQLSAKSYIDDYPITAATPHGLAEVTPPQPGRYQAPAPTGHVYRLPRHRRPV